jgi:outer membrane lipoprotein-sorting protein
MKNPKVGLKAVWIAAPAVILAAVLVLLLTRSGGEEQRQEIVLPSASTDAAASSPVPTESSSAFVQIDRDNVLMSLATLQRPSCYYQSFTVERAYDGGSATEQVSVWRQEALYRIELTPENGVGKCYLTDGQTLYLWYQDEETATQTVLPEGWTVDDLMGIPTYEEIYALNAEDILEASAVELSGGETCIYVRYPGAGDDVQEYNWISLDSGMLLQAHTVSGGNLNYRMVQTELRMLTATDAAFETCFLLPDGTAPFSEE